MTEMVDFSKNPQRAENLRKREKIEVGPVFQLRVPNVANISNSTKMTELDFKSAKFDPTART